MVRLRSYSLNDYVGDFCRIVHALRVAFLTKTLPKVAAEMALSVLAHNLTRVMNIVGIKPLIAAIMA